MNADLQFIRSTFLSHSVILGYLEEKYKIPAALSKRFLVQVYYQEIRRQHKQLGRTYLIAHVLEDLLPDYAARYAKLMQATRRSDFTSYRPPSASEISAVTREMKQAGLGNMVAQYEHQIRTWLNQSW